jgi:hypothetical protein
MSSNLALVVHRPPQAHALAADLHHHFVEMPASRRLGTGTAKVVSDQRTELQRPAPDRLIADLDTALRQQLLDVAKAQREPEVQPDGMPDHLRREAVALVRNRSQLRLQLRLHAESGDALSLA